MRCVTHLAWQDHPSFALRLIQSGPKRPLSVQSFLGLFNHLPRYLHDRLNFDGAIDTRPFQEQLEEIEEARAAEQTRIAELTESILQMRHRFASDLATRDAKIARLSQQAATLTATHEQQLAELLGHTQGRHTSAEQTFHAEEARLKSRLQAANAELQKSMKSNAVEEGMLRKRANGLRDSLQTFIQQYEFDMVERINTLKATTKLVEDELAENTRLTDYFIALDAEHERKRQLEDERRLAEEHRARCLLDQEMAQESLRQFFQGFKALGLCPPDPKKERPPTATDKKKTKK
jgi:hypothetical protein